MLYIKKKQKFDGLAKKYDKYRLRYPKLFFEQINYWSKKKNFNNILDIGSGTGIVLEGMTEKGTKNNQFYSSEISKDMISIGKKKFPFAKWINGNIENKISFLPKMDIIIFAQSLQWINRNKIFKKIKKKINKNGIICIMQNNRNYRKNIFLRKYEEILENINHLYSRKYRKIKYLNEIKSTFNKYNCKYIYISILWKKIFLIKEFIGMINSSTQVSKVKSINRKLFNIKILNLIKKYSKNNLIRLDYESELFIVKDFS